MPIIANFGGGGGVSKTDDTLTKPGLPADAKATGEALDNVKKYADSIIQISDMEPTDPNTEIWINPYEDGEMSAGGGVAVQADWNENDESEPPFVKGRTHWREKKVVAAGFKKTDATFNEYIDEYFDCWKATFAYYGGFPSIEEGALYEVAWDGVTHLLEGATYNGRVMLGNANIYDANNPDSGESFVLMNVFLDPNSFDVYAKTPGPHDVGLDKVEVIYHKLDPEFMPDGVPYIDIATVGQTIVVSAVDTSGRPTKWDAVSFPSDGNGGGGDLVVVYDTGNDTANYSVAEINEFVSHGNRVVYRRYIDAGNADNFAEYALNVLNAPSNLARFSYSEGAELDGYKIVTQNEVYIFDRAIVKASRQNKIPNKVSDLENDSGFITSYTETDPTVPAWAKAKSKPTYTAGEVGADASGTADSAVSSHNSSTSAHADIREDIDNLFDVKADKSEGAFFIEGSGTTDTTAKTSTWVGTSNRITEYYDGLTIRYKIGVAGQSTVTLNVNGLGAKTVYRFSTTKLTTQFPVGSIIHLVYHSDLNDGCWITNDYDANTNTYQRLYATTGNKEYPITTRYNTTTGETYYAEYGRYSTGVTLNPSTNTITAATFKGKLTGNADTATKATQDASGNVIANTYETKEDVTTKLAEVNNQISQLSNEKADQSDLDDLKANGVQQVPLFANSVEECTDTTKLYVLPDGLLYAYKEVVTDGGAGYTNLVPTSTDTDGSIYNVTGYKDNARLSSSGGVSGSTENGSVVTGFMPYTSLGVVRIKGARWDDSVNNKHLYYIHFYDTNKNFIYGQNAGQATDDNGSAFSKLSVEYDEVTGVTTLNPAQIDVATSIGQAWNTGVYFRINAYGAGADLIVTVNEEIKEYGSVASYQWVNTGHAFVPADYEERILDLEAHAEAIPESRIKAIEDALDEPNPADYSGNILYGKKWVACGDSFTANGYNASDGFDESVYIYQDGRFAGRYKVYPNIIGLRNNMDIVNKASGGQTMGQSSNSFMSVYQTIDADADYITIMLGINDRLQGIPVGTAEDSTNTTFCGCYNIAMEHILENHPFAHIGIMVSHGTNAEIMAATRQIAERWGVPYLDYGSPQVPLMNRYTGRNVCAKAQEIREKNFCVISDGVTPTNSHPNTAAHEFESTFVEAWLRTL